MLVVDYEIIADPDNIRKGQLKETDQEKLMFLVQRLLEINNGLVIFDWKSVKDDNE